MCCSLCDVSVDVVCFFHEHALSPVAVSSAAGPVAWRGVAWRGRAMHLQGTRTPPAINQKPINVSSLPLCRAYKTIEDDDLKFPLIYGEGKKVRSVARLLAARATPPRPRAPRS